MTRYIVIPTHDLTPCSETIDKREGGAFVVTDVSGGSKTDQIARPGRRYR